MFNNTINWYGTCFSVRCHVVHLSRGFYRIDVYDPPVPDKNGVLVRTYLKSVYATNRIDATAKARDIAAGDYNPDLYQPRLF